MSKLRGTYLIEFQDGTQIVCGNNYKAWDLHAAEYARSKSRADENFKPEVVSVKFSDTLFADDGGLKYASPKAYDEIIAELNAEDGKKRPPFGVIDFFYSNADKKKLDKRMEYELS